MRTAAALLVFSLAASAGDIASHIFVVEVTTMRTASSRQTLAAPALCVGKDGLFMAVGFALDKPEPREADRVRVSVVDPDGNRMAASILGGDETMRCTYFRLREGERAPDPVPLEGAPLEIDGKAVVLGRHGPLMGYARMKRELVVEAVVKDPRVYYALRGADASMRGSIVATPDGRLVGFVDTRRTFPDRDGLMMGVGSGTVVVVPSARFIGLEPRKRSKAWLGVNLAPFDKSREDYFGVKGDWRGALVTGVAPGSPAEKAGIKVLDLLQVIGPYAFRYELDDEWEEMLRRVQALPLEKPLPCKVVRFGPQPDGGFSPKPLDLTIVMSVRPTDFADVAAVEVKDLAITVKPVTDDWRRRNGYPAGIFGAVITRIERASAAQLAGLRINDLIQAVDGQVVRDPAALKELIAAAKKAKRKRILVLVRRGTETKFIAVEGAW